MAWAKALEYAIRRKRETGRMHYVRGYRRVPTGEWRYGVYRQDRPPLCTRGWCDHPAGRCWPDTVSEALADRNRFDIQTHLFD